jgi:hypothetical protein
MQPDPADCAPLYLDEGTLHQRRNLIVREFRDRGFDRFGAVSRHQATDGVHVLESQDVTDLVRQRPFRGK